MTQPFVPDIIWNGFRQGSSFRSRRSMNSEGGFRIEVFAGNGRKRCLRYSAGSTSGKVEMMQRRAVAVLA